MIQENTQTGNLTASRSWTVTYFADADHGLNRLHAHASEQQASRKVLHTISGTDKPLQRSHRYRIRQDRSIHRRLDRSFPLLCRSETRQPQTPGVRGRSWRRKALGQGCTG